MEDKLKERLKELEKQKNEAINGINAATATLHAVNGAMQEVNYWLSNIETNKEKNKK